jgi:hypothetical protein
MTDPPRNHLPKAAGDSDTPAVMPGVTADNLGQAGEGQARTVAGLLCQDGDTGFAAQRRRPEPDSIAALAVA